MSRPTVMVTGGARRIGAALCRAFSQAGWHVIVHYRSSASQAEALAGELASAQTCRLDLGDVDAIDGTMTNLASLRDDWRLLINCAAVFEQDEADRLEPKVFDRAMTVNTMAPALLAQSFFRHARSDHGRTVINLTDQKLQNTNPDFFSYTISKHGLDGATRMLAMSWGRSGDRVYAIAPGAILASHDQTAEEAETSHRMNLLKRRTDASEICDAALFLAEGWLESGQTIHVDSGQHLLNQKRDVIYLAREGRTAS